MTLPHSLTYWETTVHDHLPSTLNRCVVRAIAWYSYALTLVQSMGITSVCAFLAGLGLGAETTLRQRLRELCYDGTDKRGSQRTTLDVTTCFPAVVRWILAWWDTTDHRLVLAVDATTLRQTVTVLTISIVYRGCAMPVAWHCTAATAQGAWNPQWCRLLTTIQPAIPAHWRVIVATDRGLYSRVLFRQIQACGWHPFMRINAQGLVRRHDHAAWEPLAALIQRGTPPWAMAVTCFKGNPLTCTLLGAWAAQYADPWLVVTTLAPDQASVTWYGMRSWIEQGFKDLKRGGWHWEQTSMTDPERIARRWLVMSVASIWVVSVGGDADMHLPPPSLAPVEELLAEGVVTTRPRALSCFRRGIITILACIIRQHPIPMARFIPEPWTEVLNTYP